MNSTGMLSIAVMFLALASIVGTLSRMSQWERIKDLEQRLEAVEDAQGIRQGVPGGSDDQNH